MASSTRARVLRHGDDLVFIPVSRDRWLLRKILQDDFFDKVLVSAASLFERANEDDNAPLSQLLHQTVFGDHN